jgi:hypothetical protein
MAVTGKTAEKRGSGKVGGERSGMERMLMKGVEQYVGAERYGAGRADMTDAMGSWFIQSCLALAPCGRSRSLSKS